jgi:hypothetical protein
MGLHGVLTISHQHKEAPNMPNMPDQRRNALFEIQCLLCFCLGYAVPLGLDYRGINHLMKLMASSAPLLLAVSFLHCFFRDVSRLVAFSVPPVQGIHRPRVGPAHWQTSDANSYDGPATDIRT